MTDLAAIPVKRIDGSEANLGQWAGKVALVVNVASKCGLTPQYEGLEKLYQAYRDRGLVILGFPANNFRGQEPGSNAEIADFCQLTYHVDFPMFEKISVVGDDRHPLYDALVGAQPKARGGAGNLKTKLESIGNAPKNDDDVLWNFEKFLVGKDGKVVDRFNPDVTPDDPELTGAIERALAA